MMNEVIKQIWRDKYRDILFEIVYWKYVEGKSDGIWNYYVYLEKEFISPDTWERLWEIGPDDSWNINILMNIPIHRGITHFSRDIDSQRIKIGCDYNHDMDSSRRYNKEIILIDVQKTIDYIRERIYQK